jgi:hypothetical protein
MPGRSAAAGRNCASGCDFPAGFVPVSRLDDHAGQLLVLELRMAILRWSISLLDTQPLAASKTLRA